MLSFSKWEISVTPDKEKKSEVLSVIEENQESEAFLFTEMELE